MVVIETTTPMLDTVEITEINADSVILSSAVAEGLNHWQVKATKEAIAQVQTNCIIMGKCLVSTAQALHQIKGLIPKRNWIKFLESGSIPISKATAMDLVKAWDLFLSKGELSDGELSYISARSLGKVARANDEKVVKAVTKKLKAGEKVTEKEVDLMISTAKGLVDDLDDENSGKTVAQLFEIVENVTSNNKSHKIQEEAMTKKIGNLEKELAVQKKKVSDLQTENTELKAELKSLKANLKTGALA
jgi:hypothetical protein